jgi:AmmeMemoRadiSam system protein B/AmmeMemoRadiSam system protein A
MIRKAGVSGQFYPADREELFRIIKSKIDENAIKKDAIGVVLPHAGYEYSGGVAGAVLSRVKIKKTAIVIGFAHAGMGKPFAVMPEGLWQTPLGNVAINTNLARQLLSSSRYLEEDEVAFNYSAPSFGNIFNENSIEVHLPFLQYLNPDIQIVPIALSGKSISAYKEIGEVIARTVKDNESDILIIASSDMTHREPQDIARDKDMKVVEAILEMDEDLMLQVVSKYHVSMCGAGPVACLIRAVRELGGGVAELVDYRTSGETTGNYSDVVGYAGIIISPKVMHPLVALAKSAVETFVKQRQLIKPPAELTPEMAEKAGVFVSLHKGRELRGCIGTFAPAKKNVAEEIIANAINAAMEDPRFSPVTVQELADLDYSVDVLTEPEPVDDESELDPVRYGVIVEAGMRRGLLLPDLEGVNTVEKQIEICRMKAGIGSHEPLALYRFEVKRFR